MASRSGRTGRYGGGMANNGTREKIVRAAYLHFYEFGYNGSSIQNIVDAAGFPKGTFYNYFKSKEILALEALKLYACAADQVFVPPGVGDYPAQGKSPSDLEAVRKQFREATRFYEGMKFARGCLMGNFTAESADLPESFRTLINESFERWAAAIAVWLKRARKSGELSRSHKPDKLSRYLLTSWQGALLLSKSEKSKAPIDEFFLFTFDFLLRAELPNGKKSAPRRTKATAKAG
jgi:TetR/AcrR family transcriptional repressor of nem operon